MLPLLLALPWIVLPALVLLRARGSRSLDEESDAAPPDAPPVSVIVPARNERRNIERCLASILASAYPALEVIVVDDHSDDGTGDLARAIARGDSRLLVLANPPLPDGWFGKQWACATGARHARGALLLFTDADTTHAPDLVTRSVNALRARGADLLSVAGRQEMHGFWERLVQPQLFWMLLSRYGGTERVSRARRPVDAIANGQFLLFRRDAYDASGGHEAVRRSVAEDLSLAQRFVAQGRRLALVLGTGQLATRMYASLPELIRGWGKNVYAGGREAMPGGRIGRALFPLALLAAPLIQLAPLAALLLALVGALATPWLTWSAACVAATMLWWLVIYGIAGERPWYALLFPLGAGVLLRIVLGALARGRRVAWKGREYVAG